MGGKNQKLEALYAAFGEEKVKEELSKIEERNQKILCMFYGLNGEESKSVEIIAKIFGLTKIGVYKIIDSNLEKIKKILKNPDINRDAFSNSKNETLKKLFSKYTKKEILNAIDILEDEDKELFCRYYGLNGYEMKTSKEVEELMGLKQGSAGRRIRHINEYIVRYINNGNYVRIAQKNSRLENIYKKYGEDILKTAVSNLTNKNQVIMNLYLGLGNEKPKSAKEISQITGVSESSINTTVWKSLNDIERMLNNPKDRVITMEVRKQKTLESVFEKYGREKVLEGLNELNSLEKNVLIAYYGLGIKKAMSHREIGEILNFGEEETLKLIKKGIYDLHRILDDIENKDKKLMTKYNRILVHFTPEEIGDFTNVLKGEQKDIIQMYLGVNGSKESFESLMEKYELPSQKLYEIINQGLINISRTFDNMPALLGALYFKYGKKTVNECIARLDGGKRNIINNYRDRPDECMYDDFVKEIKKLEKEIIKRQSERDLKKR